MRWYKRNPATFERDTRRLALEEYGAYNRLCDDYYLSEKPLKNDDAELAAIAHCTLETWLRLKPKVLAYFTVGGDGLLHHEKCDAVLAAYEKKCGINRENGGKGGRPKGSKNKNKKPTEIRPETEPETNQKPERKKERKIESPPPPPPSGGVSERIDSGADPGADSRADSGFEKFWTAYPHQVEREKAVHAFVAALKHASVDEIVAGVERYKATKSPDLNWRKPALWLRDRRWRDNPAPAKDTPAGKSAEPRARREDPIPPVTDARWARVLARLRGEFGPAIYDNWIKPLWFHGAKDGLLTLSAPSAFKRDWVVQHFASRITALWRVETGEAADSLRVTVMSPAALKTITEAKADGLLSGSNGHGNGIGNGGANGHDGPPAAQADTSAQAGTAAHTDDLTDIPAFLRRAAVDPAAPDKAG